MLGRYRAALRWTTGAEAKAYGFTLLIWSTGTFLFYYHGFARPHEVILFVAGAFTGMALTVLIAFGRLRATWQKRDEPRRYAYGAVHLLSVSLGILAAWAIAATLPRTLSFILAPLIANLIYQAVLAFEVSLSVAPGVRRRGS